MPLPARLGRVTRHPDTSHDQTLPAAGRTVKGHRGQTARPGGCAPGTLRRRAGNRGHVPPSSSDPKVCAPSATAWAWPSTRPVTSGCSLAHRRAEAGLAKKLR
jgi:hypothetical protein